MTAKISESNNVRAFCLLDKKKFPDEANKKKYTLTYTTRNKASCNRRCQRKRQV